MSFEDDFLNGYTLYAHHFDKWCEYASTVLGNVTQCGLFEVWDNGEAYVATNKPYIGEELLEKRTFEVERDWSYSKNFRGQIITVGAFLTTDDISLYEKGFQFYWFTLREAVNKSMQRVWFFASNTPKIHNALINDFFLIKQLLKQFRQDTQPVLEYYSDRKFNMCEQKKNFFVEYKSQNNTELQKLNSLFQSIGLLKKGVFISNQEWRCIQLYSQGRSAKETSKILNISDKTIETKFDRIKNKLNITNKKQLLDILE